MKTSKVVSFPSDGSKEANRSYAKRWGREELFNKGYLPVPSLFLEHYSHLNPPLNSGEAMFVLQLMDHKWDTKLPFPGYKTIAKRMGVTDKMVRTHAQNLCIKKYLRRHMRIGQTNKFDLTPLFDALATYIADKPKKAKTQTANASIDPQTADASAAQS